MALQFEDDDHPAMALATSLPSAYMPELAGGLSLGQRRFSHLIGQQDPIVERTLVAASRFFQIARQSTAEQLRIQAWGRLQAMSQPETARTERLEEPPQDPSHEAICLGVSRRLRQAGLFWCPNDEDQLTLVRDALLVGAEAIVEQLQSLAAPIVWAGAAEQLASQEEWDSVDLALAHAAQPEELRTHIVCGARHQMSDATVRWLEARGWLAEALRPQSPFVESRGSVAGSPPLARMAAEGRLGREGLARCLRADPILRLDQLLPGWQESLGTVAAERGWTDLLAEFYGRMASPQTHYSASWIRALTRRDETKAKALFELGARATQASSELQEALMGAVTVGHLEMVQSLVGAGADPFAFTPYDPTLEPHGPVRAMARLMHPSRAAVPPQLSPLWLAARTGRLWVLRFLLECHPNLQTVSREGEHLLTQACAAGDALYLMDLLSDHRIPLQVSDGRSLAVAIWSQPLGTGLQNCNLEVWRCFVEQWSQREQAPLPLICPITHQSVLVGMARMVFHQPADALTTFEAALEHLPWESLDEGAIAAGLLALLEQLRHHRPRSLDVASAAGLIQRLFPRSPLMQAQVFEGFGFEDPFWRLILNLREPGLVEPLAALGIHLYPPKGSALLTALELGQYDQAAQILRCGACPESQAHAALRLLVEGPSARNRLKRIFAPPSVACPAETRASLLPLLLRQSRRIEGRSATGQPLSQAIWLMLAREQRWSWLPELLERCHPIQGDLHHGSLILRALFEASTPAQVQMVLDAIELHPEWWDNEHLGSGLAEQLLMLGPVEIRRDPSRLAQLQEALGLWSRSRDLPSRRQLLERPLLGHSPLVHGLPAGAGWVEALIGLGAPIRENDAASSSLLAGLQRAEYASTAVQLITRGVLDLSAREAQQLLAVSLRTGSIPALRRLLQQGASLPLLVALCPLREALLHRHHELALWICSEQHRQEFGRAAYDLQARLDRGERHPFFASFPPINSVTVQLMEALAPTLGSQDPNTRSSLLHAAVCTAPAWIPELVRLGVNPLRADRFGTTAVHLALHRHLADSALLHLCPADRILHTDGSNKSIAVWACLYRRQELLTTWLLQLSDASDRASVYLLAVASQLSSVLKRSAAPAPNDDTWNTLCWLDAKGDRTTVIEALKAFERAFDGWSAVSRTAATERARAWITSQPEIMRTFLSCAPSLVPDLRSPELPPPCCLALGDESFSLQPSLELCQLAASSPAELNRDILHLLEQLVDELAPAAAGNFAALLAEFRQRELISLGITLGFASAEGWQIAVLPKLLLTLQTLLLRARACRDIQMRAEAAHHLGLLLRIDPGWRWQIEQLRLALPPLPQEPLEAHVSHALLRTRYAALEEVLSEVFGEGPREEGAPWRAARAILSGRQRSSFIDTYGVALGLLDEPWLWAGRSHCMAIDTAGSHHRLSPLAGIPEPSNGQPCLLWTLSHRIENILLECPPSLNLLHKGGHSLAERLLRTSLRLRFQGDELGVQKAELALEQALPLWEPLASAWRSWIDWEQEGLLLDIHGLRMLRILALSALSHRLTPLAEAAGSSPLPDTAVVAGALRLLSRESTEGLEDYLQRGLALLRQMVEILRPGDPQPEATLMRWLQPPADHVYQMQAHALQELAQRLGSHLGIQPLRHPPLAESLAAYLFAEQELEQLLMEMGILLRMPTHAGLWGGS